MVKIMIPRPEHPFPQFERRTWQNLNGEWSFAFDFGKSGLERGWQNDTDEARANFDKIINVPFCPESKLSGIGYTDFIPAAWYSREFILTEAEVSGRSFIRFGAVDYDTRVFVNGHPAGRHVGGYSSFSFEITELVRAGVNTVTVYAEDDVRSGKQPRGKQSGGYYSAGCDYTRTTGIWQTVWLEFTPENYVKEVVYTPSIAGKCFFVDASVVGKGILTLTASYEGKACGCVKAPVSGDANKLVLPLDEMHLWECGAGRLYDIEVTFEADGDVDTVSSYAGMREVKLEGYKFLINGKSVFQRTVLDQGFYRDGIYTAPTDENLLRDIRLSMAAGFNGARLHQKIFEPRFLYHADKEGYLVWGEHGNWGLDLSEEAALLRFAPEWTEAVVRDRNHPSVIGWCPFNETWDYQGKRQCDRVLEAVYKLTKALDPSRPCIDTSGNFHVITDIYDLHNYDQNVESFKEKYSEFPEDGKKLESHPGRQHYTKGLPLFISEYGGIKWDTMQENKDAWGYGNAPTTEEEFIERYRGLADALLDHPYIMGLCYTQLYDIEQETNGLYDYDRNPKFDTELLFTIMSRKAAIED